MSSVTGNPANVPPLEIHDLTVAYRNKPVLWGIDLVAPAGKLIGIVGPNGAGKSTLIKACMGLLPFSSGWVTAFGGQQQRVVLARALAQKSDMYFMDEPFAGVDAATESAIISLLQGLRSRGKTIFVVHHDLPTARTYFDWLLLLNMRVVAFGPTEEVFTPELLQKTYGGRLTILSEVAEAVRGQGSLT